MAFRAHQPVEDLVVIGAGVMGRFTAYEAAKRLERVVVLERGRIGDPATASYGRTRSFRNDYLDPAYARLAHEALGLWEAFEAQTGTDVLVRCGCLNIARASVTPDLAATYAERSHQTLQELGLRTQALDREDLRRRLPVLDADLGRLVVDAGVVNLPAVTRTLTDDLGRQGVVTREGVETLAIERDGDTFLVRTDAGDIAARRLVVTAGHGTNEVLARLAGCDLQVPITRDRPSEARYFVPPAPARERFTADAMPVVAYLDAGIYCHPIVPGLVDAVTIGYYNPPDLPRGPTGIADVADFIDQCLPGLRGAPMRDVVDTDGCDYDLVADDEFVLGAVPGAPNAFVGVGWRGTGYKFAPWVGRELAGLALDGAASTDLRRFDPGRFASHEEGSSNADAAAATR